MNYLFIVIVIALLLIVASSKISWVLGLPAILIVAAFWLVSVYNRFIQLKNRVKEARSDIEVQMKRRYDLIPNLMETVKGYAAHEKGVFEKVTEARTRAMGAQTLGDHATAENMLTGALKSLFAVSENYPDLKANQNFLELQRELTDAEDKIQAARRFYNGNVRDMHTLIESFPSNLVAGAFGFKQSEFFELDESESAARQPVAVKF